jgi:hypothetical protein
LQDAETRQRPELISKAKLAKKQARVATSAAAEAANAAATAAAHSKYLARLALGDDELERLEDQEELDAFNQEILERHAFEAPRMGFEERLYIKRAVQDSAVELRGIKMDIAVDEMRRRKEEFGLDRARFDAMLAQERTQFERDRAQVNSSNGNRT